jgi:hypothetical protein
MAMNLEPGRNPPRYQASARPYCNFIFIGWLLAAVLAVTAAGSLFFYLNSSAFQQLSTQDPVQSSLPTSR